MTKLIIKYSNNNNVYKVTVNLNCNCILLICQYDEMAIKHCSTALVYHFLYTVVMI